LLLWNTLLLVLAFIFFIGDGGTASVIGWVLLLGLGIMLEITKTVFSLRALRHYRKAVLPGKAERAAFVVLFAINILFAAGDFLLCIMVIIPTDFGSNGQLTRHPQALYSQGLMDISFFAALLFAVYLAIFDFALLKALREKHYNTALHFDFETNREEGAL
ncbi:MAG TPA: hypothetical protein VHB48_07910, partial [Chitinophagaceae bacterium]|nr:hypothetical protein [Chitinophagaceae bacterium]